MSVTQRSDSTAQLSTPDPHRHLLLSDGHVVTMDDQLGEFRGDILIVDDRIAEVGTGLADKCGPDTIVVDVTGAIVIPGLIDSHVHAWEGALRGIAPDADFDRYMAITHNGIAPFMTPDDIAAGQRITAAQALNGGVTTIIDNSHNSRSPNTPTPPSLHCTRPESAPYTP